MMEKSWLNNVIKNCFLNRVDIFGDNCTFKGFEAVVEEKSDKQKDGFNSLPSFGRIVYEDEYGHVLKSEPVMIKIMPKKSFTKYLSIIFINEMNFYTKIVPHLSTLNDSFASLFPKFYHGEMMFNIGNDESAIIFEDLKAGGYKMAAKKSFLDYDHLALMMRKLGQFHAFSYKAKNIIPEVFYPLANNILETNFLVNGELRNWLPSVSRRALLHLENDSSYERYLPEINKLLDSTVDIYVKTLTGDKDNPISVICHGDYLGTNVMFRYENNAAKDLIFIDPATCRFASPVLDLITVLYVNTDQETRNKYWDSLIDEYYVALKQTFPENQVPSKSEILSQFVGRSFYAYLIACYFLPSSIADDNDIPLTLVLESDISMKFAHRILSEIPLETTLEIYADIGGESGTKALSDIFKDMIDRKFVCK